MERMKRLWKITLVTCLVVSLLSGCAQTIKITQTDVKAGKMLSGQSYIAPMDGWFISDEGVLRMLKAIDYYKYLWEECESRK